MSELDDWITPGAPGITGAASGAPSDVPGIGAHEPSAPTEPTLLERARTEYPVLRDVDLGYVERPKDDAGFLEYWPAGEPGNDARPRPKDLHIDKPGLEIYRRDTRPIDVLGDVVSHGLIESDPKIKGYYQQFQSSITPEQRSILQEQYGHARSQGESRPFDQWATTAGIPAYFRGYAFEQWPKEDAGKYYTPQQMQMFDEMMGYLKGSRK